MTGEKVAEKAKTVAGNDGRTTAVDITTALMGSIVNVLKKVSDERVKFEQTFKDCGDYYITAFRFITGYNPPETIWNEVIFVYTDKLTKDRYIEIVADVNEWTAFKYHKGYDRLYGRIVYIIPNEVKGIFKPKLVVNRVPIDVRAWRRFERTLYVVLNTKMPKEKVIASALAYIVHYFANRADRLVSSIFEDSSKKVNVWLKVRMIFSGKLHSLRRSLSSLYNYIYYRAELLEEKRRISEPLVKTIKLLADLFFTFAKEFDKYGSKVYVIVVTKDLYKTIREKVGFSKVPIFAKNVIAYWNKMNEFWIRQEAKKTLRAQAISV